MDRAQSISKQVCSTSGRTFRNPQVVGRPGSGKSHKKRVSKHHYTQAVTDRVSSDKIGQQKSYPDPEAKYHKYGRDFGGNYTTDEGNYFNIMRGHSLGKERDQLLEVAALNERLNGKNPWEIRRQVEHLRKQKQNWSQICEYVTKTDAAATLDLIEEAIGNVEDVLSDDQRENQSIVQMKDQLVSLDEQVKLAHQRLHVTQARVQQSLETLNNLKLEAAKLEELNKQGSMDEYDRAANPVSQKMKSLKQRRGLQSSLDIEPGLKSHWYPVHFSQKLKKDVMVPFEIFGETWVLFREKDGQAACIRDECAHRACPLSLGKIVEGEIQCAYHGWQFRGDGLCTKMPSTVYCKGVGVTALPCFEQDGLVWIWGEAGEEPNKPMPTFSRIPAGFTMHAEIDIEVPVEHGLLMENLLDLAHAPFTHTSTFAKGWPVPDFVKFHTANLLGGTWDPYPIDMSFEPPCMVISKIGLTQPGKIERNKVADDCINHLHQMHICLPARKGHTRLLYRMCLDFMPWAKSIPFITKIWDYIAGQVLGEDLTLVLGQQDRLMRGGDTWSHPVSYDKLAVRYRRWRNSLDDDKAAKAGQEEGKATMTAGEMFRIEEEATP